MRAGDKLYLVTRADLRPGAQAVQAAHALRAFAAQHPEIDEQWYRESNYLGLLAVEDEPALRRLLDMAQDLGVRVSAFEEPDLGGAITAVALEPGPGARRLTRDLPLALAS